MALNLVWNGDSISYGAQLEDKSKAFPCQIANLLQMKLFNYAIGGATSARQSGAYERCFCNIEDWKQAQDSDVLNPNATYLVKDNFFAPRPYRLYEMQDGVWTPGGTASTDTGRTPLVDRIEEMESDADAVGIMIGTNDFYYNWTPFGSIDEGFLSVGKEPSIHTFCGSTHIICRKLLEKYPRTPIFILTPIKRYQTTGIGRGTWDCRFPEDKNDLGLTLDDYRKAIIEISAYYSLPVIDLYSLSGLNPHIDPTYFADKDGKYVHPSTCAHEKMARIVVAQMRSYGLSL